LGDSTTPFVAIVISTLTNIALNCLFIFGCKTGVEGVAIATIIAQILSTLICLRKLSRIQILKLNRSDFATDYKLYGKLMKNGVPMALMNSITAVGCMVVQYFVNGLGVAYTSAYSACSKYINLFMQPACTAGFTMSSFTSQNFGAGKFSRIGEGLHVCLGIAAAAYVVLGSVMVFFPEQLARLMLTGDEPAHLAMQFLPVCGIMLFCVDFLFIFRSAVQGMGRPLIPMISGIIEMLMRISVIVICISDIGFKATAYAEVVAWSGALLLNFFAYQVLINKYLWKNSGIRRRFSLIRI
jgi:Na+-driven multidrug efflux pump